MELTKQIYKALAKITSFEEFEAFMRVATIKGAAVKSKFNIYDHCSKDELRTQIHGVYHDPKTKDAVATDAYTLVVVRDLYKEELQGEIMRKDGTLVKVGDTTPIFPNYNLVINNARRDHTHEAPIFEISEAYLSELAKFEAQRKAEKRKPEPHYIGVQFDTECTIWFKLDLMRKFITAARHIGATTVTYKANHTEVVYGETKVRAYPLLATGANGTDSVLLMPYQVSRTDPNAVPDTEASGFAMLNTFEGVELPTPEDNEKL